MNMFHDVHSLGDFIGKIKEYQNQLLVIIGACAVIGFGSWGYLSYREKCEEKAYRTLVASLEYFDAPIKSENKETDLAFLDQKEFKTEAEKWEKVATVFKEAYSAHRSSGIAPMFLVYQSQALANLGKTAEAIPVLREAIERMKSEPVKGFYQVKLALMLIDEKSEEGVTLLKQLAAKESSGAHDTALYQLGEYYWHVNNFDEARNYLNQLVLKYGKLERYVSPWVTPAKEKLRLIDSEVE
jgi:hypothetical protein